MRLGAVSRSAAQMRILNAATALFAEYGVGATSYGMIADALGVTKGAVYHQFKTKDEIIIAVAEMELAKLEDALQAAEAEDSPVRGRELLLNRVIDHAVEHRRAANTMAFDPVVGLLSDHRPFQQFVERLYGMLLGVHRHDVPGLEDILAEDVVAHFDEIRGAGTVPNEVDGEALVWALQSFAPRLLPLLR